MIRTSSKIYDLTKENWYQPDEKRLKACIFRVYIDLNGNLASSFTIFVLNNRRYNPSTRLYMDYYSFDQRLKTTSEELIIHKFVSEFNSLNSPTVIKIKRK